MIHLRLRTEYSFRRAFGRIEPVLDAAEGAAAGITDPGTWGHATFYKSCKTRGRKALLGAEVYVVPNAGLRERQGGVSSAFLATNAAGLRELYALISLANNPSHFYYVPRLDWDEVNGATRSGDLIFLSGAGAPLDRLTNRPGTTYLEFNPSNNAWNRKLAKLQDWDTVVCGDNMYPTVADRTAWEILNSVGKGKTGGRTYPQHILNEDELRLVIPEAPNEAYENTEKIALRCDVKMPSAKMVKYPEPEPLEYLCSRGAIARGMPVSPDGMLLDTVYRDRVALELDLIHQKNFEDYFYVITDLVQAAKRQMLVGPARGSSAGSLVCFLLGITDVDPIVHDLMFERFIDVTRADLPDIDIDFQDDRRDLVSKHLAEKYGAERVGRLGTVLSYKPKSAIGDVSKTVGIPAWEVADLKGAIIDRSTGDARAQFCIKDTFESLDIGKRLIEKYPALALAGELEGHAQYSGTHAAGLIVTDEPITHYASIDKSGCAQIDKKSAEVLNILKIDALGLRTLSVLADALAQIGKDREWLIRQPLVDVDAFEIFNTERFTGIFQYEGYALQTVCRQMKVKCFDDVAVITALARPGPLHCGAADEFIQRRIGNKPVVYLHDLAIPFTQSTYGTVIYQEQVMQVCRIIGQLSWEDVQTIRRAMSKSLGDEFFGQYLEKFVAGAVAQGMEPGDARVVWDKICTFGSWAFNKSHAVSYGLISYWCALLKAHWPLEFAAACLRSAKDEEQSIRMLRELVEEGFRYVPVDPQKSGLSWEVHDGALLGGLTNIKGLGPAKAGLILAARAGGSKLTPGLARLVANPRTPYDDIFTGRRRFADLLSNPRKYRVMSGGITAVKDFINSEGDFVFIAKVREKNQRDVNESHALHARGGRVITKNNLYLNLVLEDDTGLVFATIGRSNYLRWGKPIVEEAKVGDWFLWKGTVAEGFQRVYIEKWRKLETEEWPE